MGNYTMYVNPFLVVQNSKYTKHFYIEGQRIVSKLGAQSEAQFVKSAHSGDSVTVPVQWDKKKERSKDIIIANFEALGLDGAVFTAGKSGKMPYGQIKQSFKGFRGYKGSRCYTRLKTCMIAGICSKEYLYLSSLKY